ncbi:helix-turn-helix domain-containing protein [Paracoccus aminophilus]|uniref:helix-turn-helix domain-containing protein n=1 Tax=Paracoccus aminophilus TaxID=34003 RepID=UPI002E1A729A
MQQGSRMTPAQLRMARSALQLGVRELAELAGISFTTVSRFETGKSGLQHSTAEALRKALEARGIQFLEGGQVAEGVGVSLRPETSSQSLV